MVGRGKKQSRESSRVAVVGQPRDDGGLVHVGPMETQKPVRNFCQVTTHPQNHLTRQVLLSVQMSGLV